MKRFQDSLAWVLACWFGLAISLGAGLPTACVAGEPPSPAAPTSVASASFRKQADTERKAPVQLVGFQWATADGFLPTCPRPGCDAVPRTCAQPIVTGVDSAQCVACGEPMWCDRGPVVWSYHDFGEYIGPPRPVHVGVYRMRVDDQLEFVYRLTRERNPVPYDLVVGDTIRVDILKEESLSRDLVVQPDGTIAAPMVGPVMAADKTVEQLRLDLTTAYEAYQKEPVILVTPLTVNTRLEDLRAAVDSRFGQGGQGRRARVSPDGTIQLPGLSPVQAQGLTLQELKEEVDQRYADVVGGIEVTPILTQRAPRFVYVLGEVTQPGRYVLEAPTTVLQAISLAGGWNIGANLNQIVIFRRAEDWRLMSTKVDVRGALYGHRPIPSDELWLRDSDIILVPKAFIQSLDEVIELVFTRGIYRISPGFAINQFSEL